MKWHEIDDEELRLEQFRKIWKHHHTRSLRCERNEPQGPRFWHRKSHESFCGAAGAQPRGAFDARFARTSGIGCGAAIVDRVYNSAIRTKNGERMSAVWVITKIAVYAAILNAIYRQSYNFLFVLAQRPKTWIAVIGMIGTLNMALAFVLGWDPGVVSAATPKYCAAPTKRIFERKNARHDQ
jgi:hypothetical protein